MTNEKAIRILTRLQICADTDACDADCEDCQFNDDNAEIHEAIDMGCNALKEKEEEKNTDYQEKKITITRKDFIRACVNVAATDEAISKITSEVPWMFLAFFAYASSIEEKLFCEEEGEKE